MLDLLLHHVYERHEDEILAKSLTNCHAVGVDSVVFMENPMVRLFITRPGHTLWRNNGDHLPLSVAIHPHHCDIKLLPIMGPIENITYEVTGCADFPSIAVDAYEYYSAIGTGERGRFEWVDHTNLIAVKHEHLTRPVEMGAKELHTMYVEEGEVAAWLVLEGKEDAEYKPLCYSNHDPNEEMVDGMYQPMEASRLAEIMEAIAIA